MRYPDRYAAILLSGRAYQALEQLADEREARAIDLAREILERVLLEPQASRRLRLVPRDGSQLRERTNVRPTSVQLITNKNATPDQKEWRPKGDQSCLPRTATAQIIADLPS